MSSPCPCGCDHPKHAPFFKRGFNASEYVSATRLAECPPQPLTILNFRRIFLLLTQNLFSSGQNFPPGFEDLSCYRWYAPGDPDAVDANSSNSLRIAFEDDFDDANPDHLPAIIVGVGALLLSKEAIGNRTGTSEDLSTTTGTKTARLILTLSVFVDNRIGDAIGLAELMATFLQAAMSPGQDALGESYGVRGFEVDGFDKPENVKEGELSTRRYYKVVLQATFYYNFAVDTSIESHRLRKIFLTTDTK